VTVVRIAVLGLGEAGSEIARDLVHAGADLRGYDPKVTPGDGVTPRQNEADAVRDADLVLSVNSGQDAMTALTNAMPQLPSAAVWADLNTSSPSVKVALADALADTGNPVVDVALMAPVPGKGLATPMVASGDGAQRFAEILGSFGATVTVQDGPAGTAISRKLLRSVFYKGLAAAVTEALAGAEIAGCHDWLLENVRAELASFDEHTVERLVDGSIQHARRRTEEMAAAADQLTDLGVPPRIASAARDILADLRDHGRLP
jgi:3-hydroxyisobutyrate dehydrogenase-like beta-hydroxyacid dehydrogenase